MATFSQFQDSFLVAAYDLSERTGEEMVTTGDIIKKYPLTTRSNWLMRALFDFRDRGLVKSIFTNEDELDQSVWLTAAGMREAERLQESGVVILNADDFGQDELAGGTVSVNPNQAGAFQAGAFQAGAFQMQSAGEPELTLHSPAVDSTRWTGARLILTDEAIIRDLKSKANELKDRIHSIRFESNSDSHDLKCLCDALVAVCDMAEPELSIIDRILAHPKFQLTAGLIAAVATIRGVLGI